MEDEHKQPPQGTTASVANDVNGPPQATPASPKPTAGDASDANLLPHASPTASIDALEFTITVTSAQALFEQHSRKVPSGRTLQNYCQIGKLNGRRVTHENAEGTTVTEWMINEASLLTLIRSLPVLKNEPSEFGDAGDAEHRPLATHATPKPFVGDAGDAKLPPHAAPATPQRAGETGAESTLTMRYIDRVEDENKFLRSQIETKDKQLETVNKQITDLLDRSRDQLGFMDKLGGLVANFSERLLGPAAPIVKPTQPGPMHGDEPVGSVH